MTRTILNLIIDLSAAGLFLVMIATGYILRFVLPPGTHKTLMLCGLTRHTWGTIHFWISAGLLALLLVHVVLHWQWLVTVVGRRLHLASTSRSPLLRSGLIAVLFLSLAFALFAWIVHQNVKPIAEHVPREHEREKGPKPDGGDQRTSGDGGHLQIDFNIDIYPLLEKRCLSCHGPGRQLGGFRVDRRADFFEADGRSPLVVPGRSAESLLIEIVAGRRKLRRAEVHKLSEDDVALLKAWVDAGAQWPDKPGPLRK
ncbi:MAG: DUF4405 domain-containing protein [Deltaproteobacteria bacterium]